MALKAAPAGARVVGYDADPARALEAASRGIVDEFAPDPAAAVANADVVVVATPVDETPGICRAIAAAVDDGGVVTDVGSVKTAVVRAGERWLPGRFVGGHPMAGSERAGPGAARGDMFQGAWWILTPTSTTGSKAYERVVRLVESLGATPLAIDPEVHDDLVGRLSHLPQLVASALVDIAVGGAGRRELLPLAGPGFRDTTRIADSQPTMWRAIFEANKSAVATELAALQRRLGEVQEMLAEGRWGELEEFLRGARSARLELFARRTEEGAALVLTVVVPDRPGALAEVTRAAGERAINIEDLEITHSPEGRVGALRLVVTGQERADLLAQALSNLHYEVTVEPAEEAG